MLPLGRLWLRALDICSEGFEMSFRLHSFVSMLRGEFCRVGVETLRSSPKNTRGCGSGWFGTIAPVFAVIFLSTELAASPRNALDSWGEAQQHALLQRPSPRQVEINGVD